MSSLAAMRAVIAKDLTAVRRSKAVILPMLIVPFLLLVVLPLIVGIAARNAHAPDVSSMLRALPGGLAKPILGLPPRERLVTLVDGYLLAPLFLIVPLMLAAVLAAGAAVLVLSACVAAPSAQFGGSPQRNMVNTVDKNKVTGYLATPKNAPQPVVQ